MKKIKLSIVLVFFMGAVLIETANAQQQAIYMQGVKIAVKDLMPIAKANYAKLKWWGNGASHTWWVCQYEDGYVTYNNFRSYRTGEDVYGYFTCTNGDNGDCDSQDNNGGKVCYRGPASAIQLSKRHGPIVNIYPYKQ